MAPPPKVDTGTKPDESRADPGKSAGREQVPFPADTIGQPGEAAADGKDGRAKTERAGEQPAKADEAAGKADAAGKAAGAAGEAGGDGSAASRGGNGASKLEGGLQTVKQAVAATNNWFASRVGKAEAAVTGTGETETARRAEAARPEPASGDHENARADGRPAGARGVAERPDIFREPATSAAAAGTAGPAASARAASDGAGDQEHKWGDPPPKWNDPYPAYSTPSSSAQSSAGHTVPPAPGATAPGPLGPGPLGSDPGARTGSRGWTARPSGQPGSGASAKRQKASSARRNRRQAHLTLARVEPWSVMKFSFVVSVVAFIILFVAIAILYGVLSSIGVFDSLQRVVNSVTSSQTSAGANVKQWFSASRVLGYTGLLGSLNIVLITAMSTIGAVIYNLISRVFGGIEITLRETE